MARAPLELTFAGLDYLDRTRALIDGTVKPEGISLSFQHFSPYELFSRVAKSVEFDIAEMSFSTYASMFSRGDRRYVAIPVFLSRHFRHGFIFVHGRSDLQRPVDLIGKRVGVPEYEMTAALWQRAILAHDYGVLPEQMLWFQGGEFTPGFIDRQALPTPPGVSIDFVPENRTLHEMVASGDLDALFCPHQPAGSLDGSGDVRRLFPNFVEVEHEYYGRTGFFPIMHLTVIRRTLYEQQRWIARALFDAFAEAKEIGWRRLQELGALGVMLPWLPAQLEDIAATMGRNHWLYGFRDNRLILDAMCQYSHEQGVSQRRLAPEELFAPEMHDS